MEGTVVIKIIAEQLGINPSDIDENSTFDELGADSLDLFQIITALEEEFELEFDPDDAEKIKTVSDAIDYVKEMLG